MEVIVILHFESDYLQGTHPRILERLLATNMEKTSGYGTDIYCKMASDKIRKACDCPNAEIFYMVGGTQTNATVIDAMLKSYEGVIAVDSGHISTHEAGAIEFTGHKVLSVPNADGKLHAKTLSSYLKAFYQDSNREHMVYPGMVYLSFPTEYGTLYSKKELNEIYDTCCKYGIPLYIDGARLGYGIMSYDNDVTLPELAKSCDVFYIGGTKVGALFGEAVVITKREMIPHFFTVMKQHGALLAKGRLLGIQFDTLFSDDLYFKISLHAIDMAEKMRQIFIEKGYSFYINSPTNQIFITLENKKMEQLSKNVAFSFWEQVDDKHTVVRFATSWATDAEDVKKLKEFL